MSLKKKVESLRNIFATTIVDPVKTKSNNRGVELLVEIAEAVDTLNERVAALEGEKPADPEEEEDDGDGAEGV